jgi:hypothetical protein
VIIDQVNIGGVAAFEAENNSPVTAHRDAPVSGKVAFQRM